MLAEFDRRLIAATQSGLPLVPRPYEAIGATLGISGALVRERLAQWLRSGLVRCIGVVPDHARLGSLASGLSVWDVDDARVDELGACVGALRGVGHCCRRPRESPRWPYNLYVMLHAPTRAEIEAQRLQLRLLLGSACRGDDMLHTGATLKNSGPRLAVD